MGDTLIKLNWEQITAVAALVVAMGALVFSAVESRRSENFARAQALPAVNFTYALSPGAKEFSLSILNRAPNYAIIKWFAMFYDGRAINNYDELYELAGLGTSGGTFRMLWPETFLSGETEFQLITRPQSAGSEQLLDKLGYVSMQVCICSYLGDCSIKLFNSDQVPPADTCEAETAYPRKFSTPPSF